MEKFILFVKYGELDANSELVFRTLIRKLTEAVPDILSLATSRYQITLDSSEQFTETSQKTRELIHKLAVDGHLRKAQNNRQDPSPGDKDGWVQIKKRKAEKDRGAPSVPRKFAQEKDGLEKKERRERFNALAKKYERCLNCGDLPRKLASGSRDWAGHKATCKKPDFHEFQRTMGIVAKAAEGGKDPNAVYEAKRAEREAAK